MTFNHGSCCCSVRINGDPDDDNEGMPDVWEEQSAGLDPLVNDAVGDLDGEGYSNLKEYQGGSDPSDPQSRPRPKAMPWLTLNEPEESGFHLTVGST